MTRAMQRGEFEIVRRFSVEPSRVWRLWADPALKGRWHRCHDWRLERHELDFREGGRERKRVVEPDGTAHDMEAVYLDLVLEQRIVYAYTMDVGGERVSASLVTVTLQEDGPGTRMIFAEQVAFLDGRGDLCRASHARLACRRQADATVRP